MLLKTTYLKTNINLSNMTTTGKYSWDTQFNNNIMTHTFTSRVQVVSDLKKAEITMLVDGKIVSIYYNMPVKEYEELLLSVEEYAQELEAKSRTKAVLAKVAVYAIMSIAILAIFALAGENEHWSLGAFMAQKACCFAVMGGCYLSVKHTPALAKAWTEIN